MAIILVVVIVGVFLLVVQAAEKRKSQSKQVALTAVRHVPAFLRTRTEMAPWFEMDDLYRRMRVDLKCTRCELDRIFVCNATTETEFVDLHYAKGKIRILRGDQVLFDGDALSLMSYPEETYFVKLNEPGPPPPEGTYAHGLYVECMRESKQKS
jgi:hypothetical protein